MSIIVIDPGHGGSTAVGGSSPNNATGTNGTQEKNLTLDIAVRVAEILNHDQHDVTLTRTTDVNLGLQNRAGVAHQRNANVFVSIHFNGWDTPDVQGTEVLVHTAAMRDSRILGSTLLHRLVAVTNYRNRGLKSDQLGVLNPAYHQVSTAGCLVEVSFITDPNDEARLRDANYRLQVAGAIVNGIHDYLRGASELTEPQVTPRAFTGTDIDA